MTRWACRWPRRLSVGPGLLDLAGVRAISKRSSSTAHKTRYTSLEELLVVDLPAGGLRKRGEALQFFTPFRHPELYAELLRPSRAVIECLEGS